MKVETGLLAGVVVENAAAAATQTAGNAQTFFSQASKQAKDLTGQVAHKTSTVWNCLTRS